MYGSLILAAKALARPIYVRALKATTEFRWRFRQQGKKHDLPGKLIISLTSYPKRFRDLHLTLKTLLSQTVAPDMVILWIASNDMHALPESVRALETMGLTICPTDDLRSYKKIIPTLIKYPDAFIITADDDVYYPPHWLASFTEDYVPGEMYALSGRAHRMAFQGAALAPYDSWSFEIADSIRGDDLFFTGVGGVFYPPGIFHPDVLDIQRIQQVCPTTDDIWLNWMVRLSGGRVRKVEKKLRFREWPGSQRVALQNDNRGENGGNDQQIANMISAYGLPGFRA